MSKLLRRPLRFLVIASIESVVGGWLMNHRNELLAKFKKPKEPAIDTTRPVGDRYVPIKAGRPPSPFEAAEADSLPPATQPVVDQFLESASHVRIDPAG